MTLTIRQGTLSLRVLQLILFAGLLGGWYLITRDPDVAFFLGRPVGVFARIWGWFTTGDGALAIGPGRATWVTLHLPAEIWPHLLVTLTETVLAFVVGTLLGTGVGLWMALSRSASLLLEPYIKAFNSMPRVILAPIFATWFGLGIWSKVALAVTLVFFVVFFNVYQGVREVSPVVLANARVMGATRTQLLSSVYLPSAMTWVFSSLHNAVGLAFVGAVVGEYLGSSRGIGYLILQAEGTFDVDSVIAGIIVLTAFALALDGLVTAVEKRFMVWRPVAAEASVES